MANGPGTTRAGVRVLVIEDSPTQLEELRFLLEKSGFSVVAAANAQDGLAAVKAGAVDLVISDIVMPGMDGFALSKALRADEASEHLPVILLTALDDPRDVIHGLEAGANNFLCKPYDPPALVARVRNLLANQELRKTTPSEMGVSVFFGGQRFLITADRLQILDLLLSTYENAVNRNTALTRVRDELRILNEQLDARVAERTSALAAEIAERESANRRMQESKDLVDSIVENVPLMIFLKEAQDLRFVLFNKAGEELVGHDRKELLGKNDLGLFPPEQAAFFMAKDREVLAGGRLVDIPEEPILTAKKGTRTLHTRKVCIKGADGATRYLLGISEDITERKQAAQTLRDSEERFRLLFEQAADSILVLDILPDGVPVIRDANGAALTLLGYEREELTGQPLTLIEPTHDILKLADARRQGIRSGTRTVFEASHRCKDGTMREFECSAAEIHIGSETLAISVERDITERKRAEAERESLGTQLRQAQKMEAVGQLAGGVAHDFNNALTVILGFAELSLRQLSPFDPLRHSMDQIVSAVDKSAALTRQLLTFARRQIVTPQVLDLNVAIASLAKMLPRLIGEDIELRIVPSEGLWNVNIDPSQVDQILINLVTNARDAIANTGTIAVETANVVLGEEQCRLHAGVAPGDYLLLTVSDTGVGMDKATMEQIFDPFFTTKAEGKGTGLGLATVYGIAKQSGGFVGVYSEPGHGTTFKVYLPRFVGAAVQPEPKKGPTTLRGTETVLLVEDEPALLEIVRESLREFGYEVLAANSPGEAILLCETHTKEIHVLLTDVVMPTMNGRDLQQRLERIRPGLRTIFMSGYTADVVAHRGIVEARVPFIQKPFTIAALAGKIRETLGD